jgi:hypothetical protein
MANIELEGRYIKPPKLRGDRKLALSTIYFIKRLYVMRNAQDSENCCTNGAIWSSKVMSAYIRGEDAEQEPIAAYRMHNYQAKAACAPPKSDIAKHTILSKRS